MTRLDWARAQSRQRDKPGKLGALTDPRRRFLDARRVQLKRQAAARRSAVPPAPGE